LFAALAIVFESIRSLILGNEIQNLNINGGDAVSANYGNINLIGRRIFSTDGLSLDLASDANILVDEIISVTKGINIHNTSTQKIIIDSNKIEGSNGNDGVIRSSTGSNYVIRNAKIINTYTGSSAPFSRGIFISDNNQANDQTIEIENLIIVTGTGSNDASIYRDGNQNIDIKNLTLFVKKDISSNITLKIGTGITGNFKYIVSMDVS